LQLSEIQGAESDRAAADIGRSLKVYAKLPLSLGRYFDQHRLYKNLHARHVEVVDNLLQC